MDRSRKKRGTRFSTKTLLPVLAIALAGIASGVAGAIPATPTIEVFPDPLTPYVSGGYNPWDQPRPDKPYYIRGRADPGAEVMITVTDEFGSPPVTATVFANEGEGDPEAGNWFAAPNVTNLGLHKSTPDNPFGSSILTFTAVAKDPATGATSEPTEITATKVSATEHDVTAPVLMVMKQFSGNWCREYSCGDSSTWRTLADKGVVVSGRTSPCRTSSGNAQFDSVWRPHTGNATSCSADKLLQGTAEDYTDSSYGFASEIADVKITIVRKRDGALIKEYHPLSRRGTSASWVVVLKIADYENNEEYEWKVQATDAWGHASEETGSFKVTP